MTNEEFFNEVKGKILFLNVRRNFGDYYIPVKFENGNIWAENYIDYKNYGITNMLDQKRGWSNFDQKLFKRMNTKLGRLICGQE